MTFHGQDQPNGPFVLSTHDLARRPGTMRSVSTEVPAPEEWRVGAVEIPAGSDITIDLQLESVLDGILVSGTATYDTTFECSRCLAESNESAAANFQELFLYPERTVAHLASEAIEISDEADEEYIVNDEQVDLEAVIRDAVLLDLPLAPLCRQDCEGLCPQCGAQLADNPGHEHPSSDPRWSALADW